MLRSVLLTEGGHAYTMTRDVVKVLREQEAGVFFSFRGRFSSGCVLPFGIFMCMCMCIHVHGVCVGHQGRTMRRLGCRMGVRV